MEGATPHGDDVGPHGDSEAPVNQFLTNMGVFGSSRSSVSSDRSHSSEDYSASIQEDKDQHILLTFHKDDIDPVNKDKNSKAIPQDFVVR